MTPEPLDDLTVTKLCAEAMGLTQVARYLFRNAHGQQTEFTPLHDDAQCMALVKKFRLTITWDGGNFGNWTVRVWYSGKHGALSHEERNDDLNRAICLTVACMQFAKEPA